MDEKVTETYSEETKNELRKLFNSKDGGRKGWLDIHELEGYLQICGFNPIPEDLNFFVSHFDKNGDGKLQIDEILDNFHIIRTHTLHREELVNAFNLFDINGDGFIRLPELYSILTSKKCMEPKDASKLISTLVQRFDRDGDGKFCYADIVEIFFSDDFQKKVVQPIKDGDILDSGMK